MGGVRGNCRNCCIVHRRLLRNNFLCSSILKATKVGGFVQAMVLSYSTKSHKILRRNSRENAQIPKVLQTPLRVGRRRDHGLLSMGEGRQYHMESSGNMHDDLHGGNEVLCDPGVENRLPARRISDRSNEGV